jgi:GntR family transcriptional regulator
MPQADRPVHPYVQIARHYRDLIDRGELRPGDRVPSVAALAREWQVAAATASRALTVLQQEGLVWSSPMGTFVAGDDVFSSTPGDRIKAKAVRRAPPTAADVVIVTAAEIITAPEYVATVLGLEPGGSVIRREEVTSRGGHGTMLGVDWVPANSKEVAEAMTVTEPLPEPPELLIRGLTGRRITRARDSLRGRAADEREAAALRIPVGSPVLAGVHVWYDDDGVILYGEWVVPPDRVISYAYDVVETGA